MSDPPIHPLEEEALRRVRANLLGAIRRHERAPHRPSRRLAVAGVGAAGALAAGAGAYVALDRPPHDAQVDTVRGDPPPSTLIVTSTVPTRPATTTTTTPAPGPRPTDFVAVTNDGRLVVVDAATGTEIRQLAHRADPRQSTSAEGAPNVISGVTVDRGHGVVYYETCCEPAVGSVYSVPLAGGESTHVTYLSWPALSGDGSTLVGLAAGRVRAFGTATSEWRSGYDLSPNVFHTTVSPDGSVVAYERGNPGELVVVDVADLVADLADGGGDEAQRDALANARTWRDPDGIGWMHPAFDREGRVVVAQQCCYGPEAGVGPRRAHVVDPATGEVVDSFDYPAPVVDQEYDASGTWLLVTLADGQIQWFGDGESGTLGAAYLAADW
jgi:outer membrane protein assembly factor BamB